MKRVNEREFSIAKGVYGRGSVAVVTTPIGTIAFYFLATFLYDIIMLRYYCRQISNCLYSEHLQLNLMSRISWIILREYNNINNSEHKNGSIKNYNIESKIEIPVA